MITYLFIGFIVAWVYIFLTTPDAYSEIALLLFLFYPLIAIAIIIAMLAVVIDSRENGGDS